MKKMFGLISGICLLAGCIVSSQTKHCIFYNKNSCKDPTIGPSVVYFTKDVSVSGLDKIYQALLPNNSSNIWVHEAKRDSMLYATEEGYNEDLLMEPEVSVLFQCGENLAQCIHDRQINQENKFPLNSFKTAFSTDWSTSSNLMNCVGFEHHTNTFEIGEGCDALYWKSWIKKLEQYKHRLFEAPTLVVLSKVNLLMADAELQNMYVQGGAFENMMGGNYPRSRLVGLLMPLWANRLVDSQKDTVFITILSEVPDSKGHSRQVGILGSKNLAALQKEVNKLLCKTNSLYKCSSDTSHLGDTETVLMFSALFGVRIPEYVEELYPNGTEEEKIEQIRNIIQEKNSDTYRLVSLDK